MGLLRRSKDALAALPARIEVVLERERAQLALFAPVALGAGICAWFALPAQPQWLTWLLAWLGVAVAIGAFANGGRLAQTFMIGAMLLAAGCLLPWLKAVLIGAPPLGRAAMVEMAADVLAAEPQAARGVTRLTLAPVARPDLPAKVRVNAPPDALPAGLKAGDTVRLKARLMPPPAAALPGSYDYAVRAYFDGIGATGRAIGPVALVSAGKQGLGLRERLAIHIRAILPGPEGAIAVAFANGDQAGISEADADAMRRSGLAHLLSISGLHVSALIAGVMFLVYRLLALSPTLALRLPLILIAACAGAAAGVGYTLLTGAQVPTVRSCVAALLVIAGLMLGREAISLRLVAVGALVVMLFWPEAVVGPSFQMSFAAVTAIVVLYEWPRARAFFGRHEEIWAKRLARGVRGVAGERHCRRAQPDADRALSFPQGRAARRACQSRRHSADQLRGHAGRGAGAGARWAELRARVRRASLVGNGLGAALPARPRAYGVGPAACRGADAGDRRLHSGADHGRADLADALARATAVGGGRGGADRRGADGADASAGHSRDGRRAPCRGAHRGWRLRAAARAGGRLCARPAGRERGL